jgi:TolB protein
MLLVLGLALGAGIATPALATTPGENGYIAFQSYRDGYYDLWAINPNGTGEFRLYPQSATGAAWSPDGSEIAFEAWSPSDYEIVVLNEFGNPTAVTSNAFYDLSPTWSPDGERIAFTSDRRFANQFDLHVMNANGTEPKRIFRATRSPYVNEPDWSPDGTQIAFEYRGKIFLVAPDGTGLARLTNGSTVTGWGLSWSPDGTHIAYVRENETVGSFDIMSIEVGTGKKVNLTRTRRLWEGYPSWSPEGTMIAYSRDLARLNVDVYTMNAVDGSDVTQLTTDPSADVEPAWQPLPPQP